VLLVRCPDGGRWAGLWDFPRFQVHSDREAALKREVLEGVEKQTGVTVELGRHMVTMKHGVTRFRITLDCYEARYLARSNGATETADLRWLGPQQLADYPLSTTGRKLSRLAAKEPTNR
jgi:A/G-specific adenine glycosylase